MATIVVIIIVIIIIVTVVAVVEIRNIIYIALAGENESACAGVYGQGVEIISFQLE